MSDDDYDDDEPWQDHRPIYVPDIAKPFAAPAPPPAGKRVSIRSRKLQVIVKLANIVLTPEQPQYPGGSWHVEGMKNERIVASGIYYFVSENISESRLAFRQACNEPEYEQGDDRGVRIVYGLENERSLNQPLGSVRTQADRLIAFPNILQHRVQPFELADKSRVGRRKILVFFLVDPTDPVVSTATVPPQQLDWFNRADSKILRAFREGTTLIDDLSRISLEYLRGA